MFVHIHYVLPWSVLRHRLVPQAQSAFARYPDYLRDLAEQRQEVSRFFELLLRSRVLDRTLEELTLGLA